VVGTSMGGFNAKAQRRKDAKERGEQEEREKKTKIKKKKKCAPHGSEERV